MVPSLVEVSHASQRDVRRSGSLLETLNTPATGRVAPVAGGQSGFLRWLV